MRTSNPGYRIKLDRMRRLRYTDFSVEELRRRYGVDSAEWAEKSNEAPGMRCVAMSLWLALIDDDPSLTVYAVESILADFFGHPLRWWVRKQWATWWIKPRQIRAAQDYAREKGVTLKVHGKGE